MAEAWKVTVKQLAQAVRERRLSLELTQIELAKRSNVSLRRIQHIESERGVSNPSLRVLVQVAEALKTSLPSLHEVDRNRTRGSRQTGSKE